jgi:hypothetical protein
MQGPATRRRVDATATVAVARRLAGPALAAASPPSTNKVSEHGVEDTRPEFPPPPMDDPLGTAQRRARLHGLNSALTGESWEAKRVGGAITPLRTSIERPAGPNRTASG